MLLKTLGLTNLGDTYIVLKTTNDTVMQGLVRVLNVVSEAIDVVKDCSTILPGTHPETDSDELSDNLPVTRGLHFCV
jgi:hypothetical protein